MLEFLAILSKSSTAMAIPAVLVATAIIFANKFKTASFLIMHNYYI